MGLILFIYLLFLLVLGYIYFRYFVRSFRLTHKLIISTILSIFLFIVLNMIVTSAPPSGEPEDWGPAIFMGITLPMLVPLFVLFVVATKTAIDKNEVPLQRLRGRVFQIFSILTFVVVCFLIAAMNG